MKNKFLTILAVGLLVGPMVAEANYITVNSGFETGNLSGWSTGGDVVVSSCAGFIAGCAAAGGNYLATINADGIGNAQLNQNIWLPGSGTYEFGLSYVLGTNVIGGNQDVADFTLGFPGQYPGVRAVPNDLTAAAFTLTDGGYSFTSWRTLSRTFVYTGTATSVSALVNVNLQDYGSGSNTRFIVDNIYIRSVPEPGALALFGLGLLGLGLSKWRKLN